MKNKARFYACPYCDPCAESYLIEKTAEVAECTTKQHKKGLFNTSKKCKKEQYKCKTRKVLECNKCKVEFLPTKKFLKEQLRKLKDG